MFYCKRCSNLKDSDDGCKEAPNGIELICVDCMSEEEEEENDPRKAETEADNWYDQTHKSGD